jgi:hypothetical protein
MPQRGTERCTSDRTAQLAALSYQAPTGEVLHVPLCRLVASGDNIRASNRPDRCRASCSRTGPRGGVLKWQLERAFGPEFSREICAGGEGDERRSRAFCPRARSSLATQATFSPGGRVIRPFGRVGRLLFVFRHTIVFASFFSSQIGFLTLPVGVGALLGVSSLSHLVDSPRFAIGTCLPGTQLPASVLSVLRTRRPSTDQHEVGSGSSPQMRQELRGCSGRIARGRELSDRRSS